MPIIDKGRRDLIEKRLGMSAEDLTKRLRSIRDTVLQDRNSLSTAHPKWHPEDDVRIGTLNVLWNLLATAEVAISLLCELVYEDWWQSKAIDPWKLTGDDKASRTLGFERFSKHGFSMGLFISLERTFRIFLRAIDPTACRGATAGYESIYSRLLGSNGLIFPSQERHEALQLLDIMRVIRNLTHNDGVYYDRLGKVRELSFKGKLYRFEHAKPVHFVTWDLLLRFVEETRGLLLKIIKHPKIETIAQILDPYT
jgi:hypothetical protein